MKHVLWIGALVGGLALVVLIGQQRTASATRAPAVQVTGLHDMAVTPASAQPENPGVYELKKCSFRSDCPYGTCKHGRCGGCSFQSDCKGWGKCSNGWCGHCSFQSDCKGFGSCSHGRCTRSPY